MYRPLADEIRPQTLDDVCGQKHILGSDGLLRRIIESGSIPNMIFYGPSGCGKTTVANIIAKATGRTLHRLNATTAGVADIKAVIGDVDTLMAPEGIATTENPYFYVYNAVLSRCTVFEFKALTAEDVLPAIRRGFEFASAREQTPPVIEDGVAEYIAAACGGDVRKGLNAVEILTAAASASEGGRIALDDARIAAQKSAMRYDRAGDEHYDIISALQKSIRGSDPDAAIHYLARLVEAGDLISPCRRLQVIAAEDIGLAYPMAIPIVKACVDSAMALGYPEAAIPLADAVILLATAPKSNSGNRALEAAMADIRSGKTGQIPRHLQNRHMDSAGMEREQGYLYPHDYPDHYVKQQYLPDEIKDRKYYTFGDNKTEQAAAKYWAPIKDKEE